jgi:hypothetical protein
MLASMSSGSLSIFFPATRIEEKGLAGKDDATGCVLGLFTRTGKSPWPFGNTKPFGTVLQYSL